MKIFLQLVLLFVAGVAYTQNTSPHRLRADLLLGKHAGEEKMVVVSNSRPWLSWEDGAAVKGSSYHLLVASSTALLARNIGDCFDKDLVHATGIRYAGIQLQPGKTYYWKVKRKSASAYSQVAGFRADSVLTDTVSHYELTTDLQTRARTVTLKNGKVFFDFGKEAFGQLQIHIDSPADDTVLVEAGEMAKGNEIDNNPGRNIRYTKIKLAVKKGVGEYTIVWPTDEKRNSRNPVQMPSAIGEVYPFRYVSVTGNDKLGEVSVKRKMVHYPFDDTASSFVSSDTVLNQVWELCRYSMKATSFIGFYVDGDRERIPYEADALINQLSHYAVDAEYSIARRTLAYLLFHPTWPTEWSLQDVLIAWNDYMYTGDTFFLEKYYAELEKKILSPLAGPNGLISTRTGKQTDALLLAVHRKDFDGRHTFVDIVDWPQTGITGGEKQYPGETDGFVFNTYNAVVNAFYYRNLVLMRSIALALHKKEAAEQYRRLSEQVFHSYQQVFVNAGGLVKDGDSTTHTSLHANMFAMAFGLVPVSHMATVSAFIQSRKMACSVYGAQFLMEALYEAGAGNYAQQLMSATTQRSWYNMIRNQATISLEAWDKAYKPNLDMNHAWGAVPANIIVRKLMGLEPLEPGFTKMRIHPQTGDLRFARLTAPTIKGQVTIAFEKNEHEWLYDIIIPGAASAELFLPAATPGSRLYQNGKPVNGRIENNMFVIHDLPPGEYYFSIRKK